MDRITCHPTGDPAARRVAAVIRHLEFDRLYNFQDVGGYRPATVGPCAGERCTGRTPCPSWKARTWSGSQRLGIRTVIDLRYPPTAGVSTQDPRPPAARDAGRPAPPACRGNHSEDQLEPDPVTTCKGLGL